MSFSLMSQCLSVWNYEFQPLVAVILEASRDAFPQGRLPHLRKSTAFIKSPHELSIKFLLSLELSGFSLSCRYCEPRHFVVAARVSTCVFCDPSGISSASQYLMSRSEIIFPTHPGSVDSLLGKFLGNRPSTMSSEHLGQAPRRLGNRDPAVGTERALGDCESSPAGSPELPSPSQETQSMLHPSLVPIFGEF